MGFSLGGFVSNLFGSTNKTKAATPTVDQHAYQYGGQVNGADTAADRYMTNANTAQQRQGQQADYGQANQEFAQSQQARQGQQALAQQMQARATGQVPSIAGMQAQQDMQAAQVAQGSMAASARGPAAMALAQQQAANNTANAQSQISGQAQVNGANERMQAEQAASNAYGNMRGGDQQSQGQLAQQSQFNAQLGQNQNALNDQMTLGETQAEQNVRSAQLTAGMNQQAQQSANALGATGINAGVAGQNAGMNQQNALGMLGLGSSAASGAATGKAKGGPTAMGKPYIVGEKGPELIVPKTDGTVIPNHQLGAFLAAMHGSHAAPRAEGGPVQGGAPVTWGNHAAAPVANLADPYFYEQRDARLPTTGAMAVPGMSPGTQTYADQPLREMDQATLSGAAARRAEGYQLEDETAQQKADQAESSAAYREKNSRRNDGKRDAAPAAPPAKPKGLGAIVGGIGNDLSRQAAGVDVGYHAGQGYVPPQLLAIQTRASGGPIEGPSVPMISAPTIEDGGPQGNVSSWKDLAHSRNDGTMALMGYSPKQAEAIRNPNGEINAFEDGGTAPGGKPAVVGEAGPEIVVERPKEPTWRDTPLARSLASGKSQEGAPALPLKEGDGQYLQQSGDGHAFMAAAPTAADAGGRPSLAQIVASMKLPRSSPSPSMAAAKPTAPRQMTPDEMMAAANAMGEQQRAEHERYMAAGPALRMPVDLGKTPDGQPTAAVSFSAKRGYDTPLSADEEKQFQGWKQRYAPNDSGADYDLRGAFKAGERPGSDGHWVDTFKKPNHPTFSDQSKYAVGADAAKAGYWDGDTFVPPPGMPPDMPDSPTALPPPKPPAVPASYGPEDKSVQWAGTNYRVLPKELPSSMSRRSTGSGGRRR